MKLVFKKNVKEELDFLIYEALKQCKEIDKITLTQQEAYFIQRLLFPYVQKNAGGAVCTYMGYRVEIE